MIRHPVRNVILLFVCISVAIALVVAIFVYRSWQIRQNEKEARLATASLCVIQNENRASSRRSSAALFSVITARLRFDPPKDERTVKIFQAQAVILGRQLKALKPIDCTKYVRPKFVPTETVDSP